MNLQSLRSRGKPRRDTCIKSTTTTTTTAQHVDGIATKPPPIFDHEKFAVPVGVVNGCLAVSAGIVIQKLRHRQFSPRRQNITGQVLKLPSIKNLRVLSDAFGESGIVASGRRLMHK